MAQELGPEVRDTMRLSGTTALLETGVGGAFNMVSPGVVRYLNSFAGTHIASITSTTRARLAATLSEGVEAGESIRQLSARVRQTMSLPGVRGQAERIARTEVHNAASAARLEGYKQSGVVPKKKWHATLDARVRDNHRKLHGKVVDVDDVFKLRGLRAQAPGQFGVAAEDINCRCAITPVVARADDVGFVPYLDQSESVDAFWRLVRRQTPPMSRAVLRGFDRWERSVLSALRAADRT